MKFILCGIPNLYRSWSLLEKAVMLGDKLGFWGALVSDQYMWGPKGGGDSTMESWTILSHLSAKTNRIRLGTFVTPIPLRPPGILAKVVSTVDVISKGRTVLGVGAGTSRTGFEGYATWDEPSVRVAKTREAVELILRLWEGERVDFKGRYYSEKGAILRPRPVQRPHPPLLFGGQKRRMMELAGQYADMFYVPQWSGIPPAVSKSIVMGSARKHSREGQVSFVGGSTLPPKGDDHRASYRGLVKAAEEDGYGYLLVSFQRSDYLSRMEEFAREFMG